LDLRTQWIGKLRYKNRIKTVFLLFPILVVIGCGAIHAPDYHDNTDFAKDARLQLPERLPDVSLSIVKTAESKTLEAFFYSGGSWTASRVGAHSAVLVRHPQVAFLFDTGLGNNVDEQFKESMPFWLKPFMAYDKLGSAQVLLADEAKKSPIRTIILSHLHWDHASGIKDFPGVEVWTTKEEYAWAMGADAPEGPYIQSQYSGNDIKWRFIQFENVPYENFEQSLDVFRDGSVVLVPLPGHTLGAIGMFVNLRSGKRLFIIGDTTWALEGARLPAHKFWISSLLVDHDKGKTEQAILKVHHLMQEYPDMVIVPTHDNKAQGAVGFFPEFIH
jgi:glyoxylase-like metal-dependent hydrolase (beta-lactamase superfamily II)